MLLSEKISILRQNREMTQAQLAEQLNVCESTVQKWEKGENMPPVPELKRIAGFFQVSPNILQCPL